MKNSIKLCDGKYEFVVDNYQVFILRHGIHWRKFDVGDNAVLSLVGRAIELERKLEDMSVRTTRFLKKYEVKIKEMRNLIDKISKDDGQPCTWSEEDCDCPRCLSKRFLKELK